MTKMHGATAKFTRQVTKGSARNPGGRVVIIETCGETLGDDNRERAAPLMAQRELIPFASVLRRLPAS